MKYGIWTTIENNEYWAGGDMAETIGKILGYNSNDYNSYGRFHTVDINFAYRYLEYLTNYYSDHKFDVREI